MTVFLMLLISIALITSSHAEDYTDRFKVISVEGGKPIGQIGYIIKDTHTGME